MIDKTSDCYGITSNSTITSLVFHRLSFSETVKERESCPISTHPCDSKSRHTEILVLFITFVVWCFRPTRECFNHLEKSPLFLKSYKF